MALMTRAPSPQSKSLIYPQPMTGASLMLAFRLEFKVTLIIGSNVLAASRAFGALEADSKVIVISRGGVDAACEELKWRARNRELELLDFNELASTSDQACDQEDQEAAAIESFLKEQGPVAFVCITDTLIGSDPTTRRSRTSAEQIYRVCHDHNISVNVTDIPSLCDFTFAATHRFHDPDTDEATPLQVAVTTNGKGCRLSGRIKREMVASLPRDVGVAVEKVGRMRNIAKYSEREAGENETNDEMIVHSHKRLVPQRSNTEMKSEGTRRRMEWVAQVSEYWSITRIAQLTDADIANILNESSVKTTYSVANPGGGNLKPGLAASQHGLDIVPSPRHGRIMLVGSGPGHPSLLTLASHVAITKQADVIFTDKLVPAAVLALIPKHIEVRVARKFPGNAEAAQVEMMEAAVEAAKAGKTVVRLKQGDPMLYGRAGEEILYFRQRGFEAIVIPGVSSALAAPMFAGIPVTQRGVAESFIVCTGVGRQGKDVRLPGYERGRTLVVLMGVARLPQLLEALRENQLADGRTKKRDGPMYPPHTPIALVERASMPDQRVIMSTLQHITDALESSGEQRPPGLLIIGWAVLALSGEGDIHTLDDDGSIQQDEIRIKTWMDGKRWKIIEGIDEYWDDVFRISSPVGKTIPEQA